MLLLCACSSRDREVRTYSIAKVQPAPQLAAKAFSQTSSGAVRWTSPAGWKELPGDSIRLAIFEVPGKEGGAKAEASITVLGGEAGGLEANVNRWRQQAGLEPASADEIKRSGKGGKAKFGDFQQFQIDGAEGMPSILAAVFSRPGKTLFVKLTSKQKILETQKASFTALCRSVRDSDEN